MDELQANIYFTNARQMFWTLAKLEGTHEPAKIREIELEAAAYADTVIDGITGLDRRGGDYLLNLGEGKSVTYRAMEREAYRILKRRAEIAPNNIFNDTDARWFS